MVKQTFKFTVYSQEGLVEHMECLKDQILERDDVSYADVRITHEDETDMTYPEEALENPDEYEELTKEELERQDFVDNTIMDMIRALCGDDEYNGELVGDVRDLVIGYYALPREFYPYLQKKE